ncbi:ankyrin repeat-containing domain protein [Ochromonadaceae sp. CCMP2298]|nr:ankyrin repeat-containing domain protein [Ochromonadaceae sp. CCMP2298]|mmetsp:Transcript_33575/g.74000  ORF Transcript_33575/g.74000 Transcript_33575/m.74000 type:complete len:317 (-) Transcript_33575:74-1024(-)
MRWRAGSWTLFLSILTICRTTVGVTDELREAVHMADVQRVRFLLNLDPEKQTSRPPVIIDHPKGDAENGRTAIMMCGMVGPEIGERGRDRLDQDCLLIAQLLEQKGANLTFVDNKGWDVLSMAAVRGFTQLSAYIVSKGAPLDHPDNEGRTPLMKAAFHGHLDTFRMLLQRGANVSRADGGGLTAPHFATMFALQNPAHLDHLKGVVEGLQAAIDLVDSEGRTCLMYAAISADREVVRILLGVGADPRKVDRFNIPATAMSGGEVGLMLQDGAIALTEREHVAWLAVDRKIPSVHSKKPSKPKKTKEPKEPISDEF